MALTVPWTVAIVNTVYPVLWIQAGVRQGASKDGLDHTVQVNLGERNYENIIQNNFTS